MECRSQNTANKWSAGYTTHPELGSTGLRTQQTLGVQDTADTWSAGLMTQPTLGVQVQDIFTASTRVRTYKPDSGGHRLNIQILTIKLSIQVGP